MKIQLDRNDDAPEPMEEDEGQRNPEILDFLLEAIDDAIEEINGNVF